MNYDITIYAAIRRIKRQARRSARDIAHWKQNLEWLSSQVNDLELSPADYEQTIKVIADILHI